MAAVAAVAAMAVALVPAVEGAVTALVTAEAACSAVVAPLSSLTRPLLPFPWAAAHVKHGDATGFDFHDGDLQVDLWHLDRLHPSSQMSSQVRMSRSGAAAAPNLHAHSVMVLRALSAEA